VYYITEGQSRAGSIFSTKTKTITWSPKDGLYSPETGKIISPTTILNHELGHADNFDQAIQNGTTNQFYLDAEYNPTNQYGSIEEQNVITGIEQRTARALGEINANEVTRKSHGGILVPTEGVNSNIIKGVIVTPENDPEKILK
jgi:hypothetical protein